MGNMEAWEDDSLNEKAICWEACNCGMEADNAESSVCFAFLCCSLFRMVLVAQKMLISLAVTVGCWWDMISFFTIQWDKEAASRLFWCCSDFISGRKSCFCTRATTSHPVLTQGEGGFISQAQASQFHPFSFMAWHCRQSFTPKLQPVSLGF